jgi:alkylation response protein AidB-like acyl-CoA dehydrogenase
MAIVAEPPSDQTSYAGSASRIAVNIAGDAVQALGGLGLTRLRGADDAAGPVEAMYRDSKIGAHPTLWGLRSRCSEGGR